MEPRLKQLLKSWEELQSSELTVPTPEQHCRDCPDLLEPFRRLVRRLEQAADMSTTAADSTNEPRNDRTAEAMSQRVRYRVNGEPLLGGMGEVLPALDEELGRPVALKFIQQGKGGEAAERRFRREIAITARLQHPGIVPVFGPAVSDDGRSGYAMRFIAGESLDAAIGRHHAEGNGDLRKPTRGDLLARFEAVCNTMAYAHSHGVIHRDLKPANVMLGKYDETFVVDWGLAKILADDVTQESTSEDLTAMTAPGEDSTAEAFTATGFAMGTIAYMPPEQARGDHANLDERADVFALGAMLCKILTGHAAYTGPGAKQMARHADLTDCFARLDGSGADTDLIALGKKCLAKEVADRPKNAQAVLDALRTHAAATEMRAREDRERRVAAEAKSVEERKRLRVTIALACCAIAVLIVGGAGVWTWQQQQSLREAEQSFRAKQNCDNAEGSLAQLSDLYKRFLWDDAEKLLGRTEVLVGSDGDPELRERIAEAKRNTTFIKLLDQIRLDKSVVVEGKLDFAGSLPRYREAFKEHGFDVLNGDPAELAAKLNSSPVRKFLLEALDEWAMTEPSNARAKIVALTAAATGQSWRTQLADASKDGYQLERLFDSIPETERTPAVVVAVGRRLDKLKRNGVRPIESALRQYPSEFWLHYILGSIGGAGRADARIGACRAALAIRPGTTAVICNLGSALHDKKEYDAAIAQFKEALQIDSSYAIPHCGMGMVLRTRKNYDAAIAEYKEAIRLDPYVASFHNNLGNALRDKQEYDAAISEYKEAIRLYPKYSWPHNGIGITLRLRKEYDAAIKEFNEAIRLDPTDHLPHNGLGNVFEDRKEYDAAIAELKEAIRLDPKYPIPHFNLGNVFKAKKDYDAAIAEYKEAIHLDAQYASPHNGLGAIHRAKKEYDAALAEFKEVIRLDPNYTFGYANIGLIHRDVGRFAESVEAFEKAIGQMPNHAGLQNDLRRSQQYLAMDARYPDIRRGTAKPKNPQEAVQFAEFAARDYKKDYAVAFQLYRDSFSADAKLVQANRYNAARAAVQFAAGKDEHVTLDMDEWYYLQGKARAWLSEDLADLRKLAASSKSADREKAAARLADLMIDADLAPVRDSAGQKAMPDDERQAWQALWAEVPGMLQNPGKRASP